MTELSKRLESGEALVAQETFKVSLLFFFFFWFWSQIDLPTLPMNVTTRETDCS